MRFELNSPSVDPVIVDRYTIVILDLELAPLTFVDDHEFNLHLLRYMQQCCPFIVEENVFSDFLTWSFDT